MLTKFLFSIKKTILFSTTLITVAFLINEKSISAASFSFTPSGSQLDQDSILDLVPGSSITFNLFLDTTGLPAQDPGPTVPTLGGFDGDITWDHTELEFVNFTGFFDWENSLGLASFQPGATTPGQLPTNAVLVLSNPKQDFSGKVGEITFNVKSLINDGKSDFSVDVIEAFVLVNSNSVDVSANFGQQDVEVQTPEPSTILGIVSILGLAQFFRKQKIKK